MGLDVVVGAGIAGLATAFHLMEQGRDVVVLEGSPRVGGRIHTRHHAGLTLEQGPQSLQTGGAAWRLLGRLGLRGEITWADPRAKHRYVLKAGRLVPVPAGPGALMGSPLLGRGGVLRALAEPLVPRGGHPEETLHALVARRLGMGVADGLLDPFVAGVFGGDPRQLDAAASFPVLVEAERTHGSLVRGLMARREARPDWVEGTMCVVRGGMRGLPRRLHERLGARVVLRSPVRRLVRDGAGWRLEGEDEVEAERVWVCAPPASVGVDAGPLPHAPLVAVHLAWPREAVSHRLDGFGWLCAARERTDALGALWVSSVFPGHAPGWALVRVMMGGARDPGVAELSEDALVARARRVVAEVEGVHAAPTHVDVARHVPGIPQPPPGYGARVARLQEELRGVRFLGWHVSGVGMSHILDAAERLTAA